MSGLWQDFAYAARSLRKAPGFTAVAVAVLAIGIGATSALFSLLDAALLRPLPFAHPEDLVMLWERAPEYAHNRVAPLNFVDWSEQNHAFRSMAAVAGGSRTMTGTTGGPERVTGQAVTVSFFDLLGVKPIAGRTFISDDAATRARVVVLSERFWRSRFGSDPTLVGRPVMLDGQPFTVIGIVPADFQILFSSEIWTPFVPRRSPEQRRMHYLQVLGRLKPGTSLERARADMAVVAESISSLAPETNKGWGVTIEPLRQALVGTDLRVTTLVLGGVVGFVLLMACANVANLVLARGVGRTRELAVRAALGAGRARILRQSMTESVLLAAIGGVAGLAVAWVIVRAAPSIVPPGTLPEAVVLAFDARLTAFGAALTLATSLLFGLVPAWHAARTPVAASLAAGGRTSTGRAGALRTALAVGEVAAAVLLLSGAGLLLRTLVALDDVDPGYRASNVLTMHVSLPVGRYPTPERALAFYQAAEREIAGLPGVRIASLGGNLPLDGWDIGQGFEVVGNPAPDAAHQPAAHYQIIGPRYFDALGIRLLRGRAFTDRDTAATTPVCIVNEEFARRHLAGRDPIGRLVSVQAMDPGGPKPVVREVVGVVRQVKVEGPGEKENALEIYVPIAQNPWYSASIAVRTAGDPMSLAPAVKAAIARVDKDQPVTRVRTMDEVASESTAAPRFRAELVGAFAVLALVLAAAGVFGVLAFTVSQRMREFGVRKALGARPGDVLRLVLAGGLRITLAGSVVGLGGAAVLTRSLESLLYGVKPLDPLTLMAAPVTLGLTALVACAAPALRAARADAAVALRQD